VAAGWRERIQKFSIVLGPDVGAEKLESGGRCGAIEASDVRFRG
jgi:hypothetical protein